jgi:error-prone DNA polymerase
MREAEHVMQDYASTSLSVKAHPLHFIREKLSMLHVLSSIELAKKKNGDTVKVAGIVIVRQRPETAKGVWFITLEDETGFSNLVIFKPVQEKFKKEIVQSRVLMVEGKLQIESNVIHVMLSKCYNITKMLHGLLVNDPVQLLLPGLPHTDALKNPKPPEKIIPDARNFK